MKTSSIAAPALAFLAACGGAPEQGEQLQSANPWPRPAPAIRLAQQDGAVFDLAEQRGNVVLLFFGYTHCPDVCPTTLADFASVKRALGPRAERVRFVFISVDWGRDRPEDAMRYARAFDPAFVGLAADSATLGPILRGLFVGAYREAPDSAGNYAVAHSAGVYVVDPAGQVREPVRWTDTRALDIRRAVEQALAGA